MNRKQVEFFGFAVFLTVAMFFITAIPVDAQSSGTAVWPDEFAWTTVKDDFGSHKEGSWSAKGGGTIVFNKSEIGSDSLSFRSANGNRSWMWTLTSKNGNVYTLNRMGGSAETFTIIITGNTMTISGISEFYEGEGIIGPFIKVQ
jgi:hypothetical protein